jgi:aryl-alcohol dehydrogenase-like predicted oxidoreductase
LEYRSLGTTGLNVSAVGLGCGPLGITDWGKLDLRDAVAAVHAAWDQGINLFDTADVYGLGESERILSKVLGKDRHEAVIVSKFGVRWKREATHRAKTWRDSSGSYLIVALDASLRRLRIERIPIYLVHWPDVNTPLAETIDALEGCRVAGKIGVYGISNFSGDQLTGAVEFGASVVELPLNLIERRFELQLDECNGAGVGAIAYGAYAQGLLCGGYDRTTRFKSDDRRHRMLHFADDAWDVNEEILARIRRVGSRRGVPDAQIAIRWVLQHQSIDSTLVSAKNPKQLADAIAACEWQLTWDEYSYLSGDRPSNGEPTSAELGRSPFDG